MLEPRRYRPGMDLALLDRALSDRGEPGYRARQVWEWTARGSASYEQMTTLAKPLRAALAEEVPFSTLEVVTEREARDGTMKVLFRTHDGHPVEAVLMRYRDGRRSLCLSSQSGCPLTCTFCATGAMRFGRNLSASEILDQALHFRRMEPVNHAVYMGMGEPFLNYDAVVESARRLPDLGITHRRTTISTVGWMPGLRRFVDEVEEPIRLALSIHAADPELRSELMPVNDRYPLGDVLAECRRYFELRRRKVFVEYVMLAGVNDSKAAARSLAALLDPRIVQGQPHPVQPHRRCSRAPRARRSRRSSASSSGPDPGHGEAHARPRHRGGLRPARDGALMERVTGVGGVFFRARDPDALRDWYAEHLGVPVNDDGYVIFPESRNTVWAPFAADTDYWPAEKQGMVNFTVSSLDPMLAQLRDGGSRGRRQDRGARGHRPLRLGGRPGGKPLRALGAAFETASRLDARSAGPDQSISEQHWMLCRRGTLVRVVKTRWCILIVTSRRRQIRSRDERGMLVEEIPHTAASRHAPRRAA